MFKVGDRVIGDDYGIKSTGTVVWVEARTDGHAKVLIEHDTREGHHGSSGTAIVNSGRGWIYTARSLTLLEKKKRISGFAEFIKRTQ